MLRDFLSENLLKAFRAQLADAYTPFTLKRVNHEVDPATDQNITSEESFSGEGCFGKFSQEELIDPAILVTDRKLLILQKEFATKPKIGDIVDTEYLVNHVSEDPVHATWVLALRGYNNGLE